MNFITTLNQKTTILYNDTIDRYLRLDLSEIATILTENEQRRLER